ETGRTLVHVGLAHDSHARIRPPSTTSLHSIHPRGIGPRPELPSNRGSSATSRRVAERQVVPRLPDLVREVDEHVLDLRVVLEGVDAEVLPEAALLVPAMRHLAHDRQVVVDLHGTEAERVRGTVRPLDVLRPDGRVQAVHRIVRRLDRFVFVGELLDVDDRSEYLLAGDPHGRIRVDERGGLIVPAFRERLVLWTLPAKGELRALVLADLDVLLDLLPLLLGDERPEVRRPHERVAHADRLQALDELVLELLVGLLVDDEPRGLRGVLAAIDHRGGDGPFRGGRDVRVVEHDEGPLAAEFEVELLHVRLRGFHDVLPGRRVAGQGDHVDLVARCELMPDDPARTRDQIDGPRRDPGLLDELPEFEGRERRERRRLQDRRVARGEGGRKLPDCHHERIVPWRDLADDADWFPPDDARPSVGELHRGLAGPRPGRTRQYPQVVVGERELAAPRLLDRR